MTSFSPEKLIFIKIPAMPAIIRILLLCCAMTRICTAQDATLRVNLIGYTKTGPKQALRTHCPSVPPGSSPSA